MLEIALLLSLANKIDIERVYSLFRYVVDVVYFSFHKVALRIVRMDVKAIHAIS